MVIAMLDRAELRANGQTEQGWDAHKAAIPSVVVHVQAKLQWVSLTGPICCVHCP